MSSTERPLPDPYGYAPIRRCESVRRTSSIDMTWPNGRSKPMRFKGMARDLLTGKHLNETRILAADELDALVDTDRTIIEISARPSRSNIGDLCGVKGGGYLRGALNSALPNERNEGTPLYLLIDDISGASLIAGWAWTRWPDYDEVYEREFLTKPQIRQHMKGVCIGFREGSTALDEVLGTSGLHRVSPVVNLADPKDPLGWHPLKEHDTISMRRARRIDVWLEQNIRIEAMFQDSASVPGGSRVAVHEYSLCLSVDPATLCIATVDVKPHILPYPECPSARQNVQDIVGTPLGELRQTTLERLSGDRGCTHLNDALRALAEVPVLVKALVGKSSSSKI